MNLLRKLSLSFTLATTMTPRHFVLAWNGRYVAGVEFKDEREAGRQYRKYADERTHNNPLIWAISMTGGNILISWHHADVYDIEVTKPESRCLKSVPRIELETAVINALKQIGCANLPGAVFDFKQAMKKHA